MAHIRWQADPATAQAPATQTEPPQVSGLPVARIRWHRTDAQVATTKATLVHMRGRDMPGWLRVSSDDLRTDDQLARWVEIGTGYARSLPPK